MIRDGDVLTLGGDVLIWGRFDSQWGRFDLLPPVENKNGKLQAFTRNIN